MVAERRVTRVGRVDKGVALVESPAGFDADLLRPSRGRHLQLRGESNFEAGCDDSSSRGRVVEDRPIAVARKQDRPAPAVGRQVAGECPTQLPVCSEC